MLTYETVIGLEVHVHLNTQSKVFCGCSTEFGQKPNSQVCPVCLGFPGSLPVLNKKALEYGIKVALALHCTVQEYTRFDRKNYFYPDLPKDYQISQYDLPFSREGYLDIKVNSQDRRIGICRVHLEEDAGKLIHRDHESLVDYNRAGVPLLEIVSNPDIRSPEEAQEYLSRLKSIIEYLGVSDCDMEKGSLRCDANISVRQAGTSGLGVKTELKNMNSFKAVKEALAFEARRQAGLVSQGEKIVQETLLWDEKKSQTSPMRTKEEAQDYRYFPDPDLPPFTVSQEAVDLLKKSIPELPQDKLERFMREYSLSEYDAAILVSSRQDAEFAEDCIKLFGGSDKKTMVNWLTGSVLAEANQRLCSISELAIPGGKEELVKLVALVEASAVSNLIAKTVLAESLTSGISASQIIREKNLAQISDLGSLEAAVDEVIKNNPKSVEDYSQGKSNALMFLVGQVMKNTKGKANPKVVGEILKRRLG